MEQVDSNILGFAVLCVSQLSKEKPLYVQLTAHCLAEISLQVL
jgi:hypothetical protein